MSNLYLFYPIVCAFCRFSDIWKETTRNNCLMYIWCIFWPAFGCCAPQTLVEIVIFSVLCSKKLKKARNLEKIFAKNKIFKFAPEPWSTIIQPFFRHSKVVSIISALYLDLLQTSPFFSKIFQQAMLAFASHWITIKT